MLVTSIKIKLAILTNPEFTPVVNINYIFIYEKKRLVNSSFTFLYETM